MATKKVNASKVMEGHGETMNEMELFDYWVPRLLAACFSTICEEIEAGDAEKATEWLNLLGRIERYSNNGVFD